MNLFVFGYFGCGNLGDEAILSSFIQWAGDRLQGVEITAQSSDPAQTRKNHGIGAVPKFNAWALWRALSRCDAVVAPGGGLLQDTTSMRSVIYYAGLIRLAQAMGKPVFLLSQGIGPLRRPASRAIAARALRRCRHAGVRDKGSADLLRGMGVPEAIVQQTGDLVLLRDRGASAPARNKPEGARLAVGLSLRPSPDVDRLFNVLLGCLLRLNEQRPIELSLFAMSRDEDLPLLDDFAARIKERCSNMPVRMIGGRDDSGLTVEDMESAVADLDIMIGMRLHSLVFAAGGRVPFVGLSYDPKVAAFAARCGQPVVESLSRAEPLEIMRRIEQALEGAEKKSEAMGQALKESRDALLEDLDRFCVQLSEAGQGPLPILGVPVSRLSFNQTVRYILYAAERGRKLHVVTVNPEMILRARRDAEFRRLLCASGLNTADGVGARLAYLLKYGKKIEPVAGVEILDRILAASAENSAPVFLIGSRPEVIQKAVERAMRRSPRPLIAGSHHGYIRDTDPEQITQMINDSGASIVFAGMGSPMQEHWIRDNMDAVSASVFIGVGGSFDVLAGATRRAPAFFQKTGTEWLYRVVTDPSRLGRIAGFPFFVFLVVWEALLYRLGLRRDV